MAELKNSELADAALNNVLTAFQGNGRDLVGDIAHATIARRAGGKPSDNWSLLNRLLQMFSLTDDGRTFNAWREVGRFPKRGCSAFYILRPNKKSFYKDVQATDPATGAITTDRKRITYLTGFGAQPEFRLEDTQHPADTVDANGRPVYMATIADGDGASKTVPLAETLPNYAPETPPPLADVATAWGIDVTYQPSGGFYWGAYDPRKDAIELRTTSERTFFHELAHAAHRRVLQAAGKDIQNGQVPTQEVTAELTAAVLARMYGAACDATSYRYIQNYANGDGVHKACVHVLSDVQSCLDLILQTAEGKTPASAETVTADCAA